MIPFVDCQGLAGAWSLGTAQAGFKLAHRTSLTGGFGDACMDANRALVGDGWEQEVGPDETEWTPQDGVGFLCGTPPCSGFSGLNKNVDERGPGNPINSCMRSLVAYAAACTGLDGGRGPEVVSFESVQGAYTKGRVLMQALRDLLEERTGQRYAIHHVLMSGATVGAAQMRHRYYPVFSRVPFGADEPDRADLPGGEVVTYYEALADLQGLDTAEWGDQRLLYGPAGEYAARLRRDDGLVSGHVVMGGSGASLVADVCERGWPAGISLPKALRRLDYWPPGFERRREGDDSYDGAYWPRRVHPARPGWVLSGQGARSYVHWSEPRYLTIRECTRLMGYPDSWTWPTGSPGQASAWIGKCCPVTSGRWISTWVRHAIEGAPGSCPPPMDDGEREHYYNYTLLYKDWLPEGQRRKSLPRPRAPRVLSSETVVGNAGVEVELQVVSVPSIIPARLRASLEMPDGFAVGDRVRHRRGDEATVIGYAARTGQLRLRRDDGKPTEWKPERCAVVAAGGQGAGVE